MNENDDLKLVYTGSFVEAQFIGSLLEENGIGAMVRNTLGESLIAGWASGAPEDSGLVYVAGYHETQAESLIREYLNSQK